jgi:thioredoxin reductase (NADPH)
MSPTLILLMLVAVSLLITWWWSYRERQLTHDGRAQLEVLSELGDVVPPSLHPVVDPLRCIGSGSCVQACPEKQILRVVNRRAELINPLACVGHGACAAACPTNAIQLVFGTAKRGLELPAIDAHFETNQEGVFIIGELGGMGLIRNAVEQGRQAAAHIVAAGKRGAGEVLDAVVVGAGPAGLSAALALHEAGLRYAWLEREEELGGTILQYPRAKVVMTGTLELALYGTVKKRTMRKEELLTLWHAIAEKTGVRPTGGVLVTGVEVTPFDVRVRSADREWRAANVLLALGRSGAPQKLGVPGEQAPHVSYRLHEADAFAGKHVVVVGGGNSAVESALMLANAGGCASVAISYRKERFLRARGDNRQAIERAIEQGRVAAHAPSRVLAIHAGTLDLEVDAPSGPRTKTVPCDALIIQVGGTPPSQLLSSIGIELVTKYGER